MRTLSASQPHTAVYQSTSELRTPLYTGQPAGSQWCTLQRGSTVNIEYAKSEYGKMKKIEARQFLILQPLFPYFVPVARNTSGCAKCSACMVTCVYTVHGDNWGA